MQYDNQELKYQTTEAVLKLIQAVVEMPTICTQFIIFTNNKSQETTQLTGIPGQAAG